MVSKVRLPVIDTRATATSLEVRGHSNCLWSKWAVSHVQLAHFRFSRNMTHSWDVAGGRCTPSGAESEVRTSRSGSIGWLILMNSSSCFPGRNAEWVRVIRSNRLIDTSATVRHDGEIAPRHTRMHHPTDAICGASGPAIAQVSIARKWLGRCELFPPRQAFGTSAGVGDVEKCASLGGIIEFLDGRFSQFKKTIHCRGFFPTGFPVFPLRARGHFGLVAEKHVTATFAGPIQLLS